MTSYGVSVSSLSTGLYYFHTVKFNYFLLFSGLRKLNKIVQGWECQCWVQKPSPGNCHTLRGVFQGQLIAEPALNSLGINGQVIPFSSKVPLGRAFTAKCNLVPTAHLPFLVSITTPCPKKMAMNLVYYVEKRAKYSLFWCSKKSNNQNLTNQIPYLTNTFHSSN